MFVHNFEILCVTVECGQILSNLLILFENLLISYSYLVMFQTSAHFMYNFKIICVAYGSVLILGLVLSKFMDRIWGI